jgi:dienelactone hydrolase
VYEDEQGNPFEGALSWDDAISGPRPGVTAAVLVLHGWEDPLSPREQAVALADELTQKGADWQIHMYGHTAHAFTNPKAQAKADGMYFVPKAADRGWQVMKDFLAEKLER